MKIAILSKTKRIHSTRRLIEAIEARGHEAVVLNHYICNLIIEQGEPRIHINGHYVEGVDAIIPRIGASVTTFGAAVIRQFEAMSVVTSLSSTALVRSRDKLRSLQLLSKSGIGIPKTVFAKAPKDDDVDTLIEDAGGAPVILKLLESALGKGVIKADSMSAARSTIEAFSGMKQSIIIQEFIEEADSTDVRAFVVDGEIVGAMMRRGKEGDFRSNLHRGGSAEVVELSKKEKAVAIEAVKILGLSVAGVDMLRSERGPLVLEVNSTPGLEGIEKATSLDIADKIIDLVESKVEAKRAKKAKAKAKKKIQ
jgi:ribosomal protein S6--L-glutamate ligase